MNNKMLEQLQNEYCDLMNGATFGDIAQFAKEHRDQLPQIREKWQKQQDAEKKRQEQERRDKQRRHAVEYCDLCKSANNILRYAVDLLNEQAGKPYGQKTAEKINQQINQYAESVGTGYNTYLEKVSYCLPRLSVYRPHNYINKVFASIDFLTDDNKIKKVKNLRLFDENDANKLFDELQTKKAQLAEMLKTLKPLVTDISDINGKLNFATFANCNDIERLTE